MTRTCCVYNGFHEQVLTDSEFYALVGRCEFVEAEVDAEEEVVGRQRHRRSQEVTQQLNYAQSASICNQALDVTPEVTSFERIHVSITRSVRVCVFVVRRCLAGGNLFNRVKSLCKSEIRNSIKNY